MDKLNTYQKSNHIVDTIGYIGPLLLAFENTYILWNRRLYLIGYLIAGMLNTIINKILKGIFREPRPIGGVNIFDTELHYGPDIYGMPSGHAQTVAFSTVYLYMANQQTIILVFNMGILLLTAFQRWNYKKHTINQLLIGSIIGSIIAYSFFHMIRYWIENRYQHAEQIE
jgi:membrane-associated phospholipid phosphatase